jgi:hypothetical protein
MKDLRIKSPHCVLAQSAANWTMRALLDARYRAAGQRPLYLALCWIWDLGSAVLQGTLRICMPALAAYHRAAASGHRGSEAPEFRSGVARGLSCRSLVSYVQRGTRGTRTPYGLGGPLGCLLKPLTGFGMEQRQSRRNRRRHHTTGLAVRHERPLSTQLNREATSRRVGGRPKRRKKVCGCDGANRGSSLPSSLSFH